MRPSMSRENLQFAQLENANSPPIGPSRWTRQALWSAQHRFAPYFFITPFLIVFSIFFLYPLLRSIPLSLETTSGAGLTRYVGLSHFHFLLTDWLFWLSVANTLLYAASFLLLQIPLSLGIALLLDSRLVRCRNGFRFAFFSSNLVGQVFVAMIFSLLLAPRHGLINRTFGWLLPGGVETDWRGDPHYAMGAMVIATLWLTVGYGMIYFLAALQAVDHELYEASQVDGAWRLVAILARDASGHSPGDRLFGSCWNHCRPFALRTSFRFFSGSRAALRGVYDRRVSLCAGF